MASFSRLRKLEVKLREGGRRDDDNDKVDNRDRDQEACFPAGRASLAEE